MGDLLFPNYVTYPVSDAVTYLIATLCIVLLMVMVILDMMTSETSH